MKKIILVYVFICANVIAQTDCDKLIALKEDNVTGSTFYTLLEEFNVSQSSNSTKGFNILVMKVTDEDESLNEGEYMLSIRIIVLGGGSCVNEGDKINILFRDGTRMTLANDTDFNCEAEVSIDFHNIFGKENRKNELTLLSAKEIEIMRVWTMDEFVEVEFTENQSSKFKEIMNCMAQI